MFQNSWSKTITYIILFVSTFSDKTHFADTCGLMKWFGFKSHFHSTRFTCYDVWNLIKPFNISSILQSDHENAFSVHNAWVKFSSSRSCNECRIVDIRYVMNRYNIVIFEYTLIYDYRHKSQTPQNHSIWHLVYYLEN